MTKNIVYLGLALLLAAIIYVGFNLKSAYEFIPIKVSNKLEPPAPDSLWREFEPQTQRFKVLFPAPPQYAKETVPDPKTKILRRYEMYISQELEGPIYMISLITYPDDVAKEDPEAVLKSVVEEMMATKDDNKLKSQKFTQYLKFPAMDFNITNSTFNVMGKAFVVNRTVYLLTYIANIPIFEVSDYEYFIKSFKLLPKGEKTKIIQAQPENVKSSL